MSVRLTCDLCGKRDEHEFTGSDHGLWYGFSMIARNPPVTTNKGGEGVGAFAEVSYRQRVVVVGHGDKIPSADKHICRECIDTIIQFSRPKIIHEEGHEHKGE